MMGVKRLPAITNALLRHGLDTERPAAVIEAGTTARQRAFVGTLGTIAGIARKRHIEPPAITVIGDVVRLREMGFAWYDLLPEDLLAPSLRPARLP